MGLNDTRRANSDLNIDASAPAEELDIISSKVLDLSPAISGEQQKYKAASTIPESLDGMVSDTVDTNRQVDAIEFNASSELNQLQNKVSLNRMEQAQRLELANTQYDSLVAMTTEVEQAKQKALSEGRPLTPVVSEIFEKHRNDYDDSPAGQEGWMRLFQDTSANTIKGAINDDYTIQQVKAAHNLENANNTAFQSVLSGSVDIDTAFNSYVKQAHSLSKDLKSTDTVTYIEKGYNNLVIAKAMQLQSSLTGSNGEQVAASIQQLIKSNGSKVFNMVDSNGAVIKDKKGQPEKFTATLDTQTVSQLMSMAQTAEHSVSSAGAAGASIQIGNYKDYVGYADLEKSGVSDYLMSVDVDTAKRDYLSAINTANTSNATPKAKSRTLEEISEVYYDTVLPVVLANKAMQLTPDTQANRRNLINGMAEIKKKLNSGENMANFSYTFNMGNGGTFTLKPELNSMSGSNPVFESHNSWTKIYQSLEKAVGSQSNSDFAYRTNRMYNSSMGAAVALSDRTSMVSVDSRGIPSANQKGISDLAKALLVSNHYLKDATKGSSAYSPIPSVLLDRIADNYTNCPNKSQQITYMRGVAMALRSAGLGDVLLSPKTSQKSSNREAVNSLMTEMYLSTPGLNSARNAISNYAASGGGPLTEEAATKYLQTKGYDKNVSQVSSELIKKYRVPLEYQESLRATLRDVSVALASQDVNAAKNGEKWFDNSYLEKVVKNNFVKLDTPYVKESVFAWSPVLAGKDPAKVANQITQTCSATNTMLKQVGIDTNKYPVTAMVNNGNGFVSLKVGGKALGLTNNRYTAGSMPIGVPFNAPKPKSYTQDQWNDVLTSHATVGAVLTYAADPRYSKAIASKLGVDPVRLRTDAVRIMSRMQSDSFFDSYRGYKDSGHLLKSSNPAPSYLATLFNATQSTPESTYGFGGPKRLFSSDTASMLNFAYSLSTAHNKVNTVTNKPLSYEVRGHNYYDVLSEAKRNGFVISRGYDPGHVWGTKTSPHNRGLALDFGIHANNMLNNITGKLDVNSVSNFLTMMTKNPAYGSNIKFIYTSRPELLENKPEYAAYAKFRNMKTSTGRPLFEDARNIDKKLLVRNHHDNHFHVQFNNPVVGKEGALLAGGYKSLANDMVANQTDVYKHIDNKQAAALVGTFANDYSGAIGGNKTFGIANLTKKEYNILGIPDNLITDPVMQTRALGNRFQAYSNALGNEDLAVFALAGAKFTSSQDNKTYDIRQIMDQGLLANGERMYRLATSKQASGQTAADQARINSYYRKYKRLHKNEGTV